MGQFALWAAVFPFPSSLPIKKMKVSALICFSVSQLCEYKGMISEKNGTHRNAGRASGAWRRAPSLPKWEPRSGEQTWRVERVWELLRGGGT